VSYRRLGLAGAPSGDWGQLVTKDGFRYQLTDDDVLWAARMIYGEGGDDLPGVLWATAQRFAGIPARRRLHPTYRGMLVLWSEPLMASRTDTGSYCLSHLESARCTPRKMAVRELIRSLPWEAPYPSSVTVGDRTVRLSVDRWERAKRIASRWARGEESNTVPQAIDMAHTSVAPPASYQVVKQAGGNVFYNNPLSRGWPADQVVLEYAGRIASAGPDLSIVIPVVGVVGVAAAAGFAFWAWRRSR